MSGTGSASADGASNGVYFASLWEFLDARSLSFVFINVLIFVIIQAFFFWFVAGNNLEEVALSLSVVPVDYYTRDEQARVQYCTQDLKLEQAEADAAAELEANKLENWRQLRLFIVPFGIFCLVAIALCFAIMIKNRESYHRGDVMIIVAICCAFLTEVYYFFAVVGNVSFIGEQQILSEVMSPGSSYGWSSPLFGDLYAV